jgi:hypothetical protein
MTEVERTPVLVLSQKAAKLLRNAINDVLEEYEDVDGIFSAIVKELDEQIEAPKKKAKKSKPKKHK